MYVRFWAFNKTHKSRIERNTSDKMRNRFTIYSIHCKFTFFSPLQKLFTSDMGPTTHPY